MRILYGINGTGNGHRSRARDLVPALSRLADVDVVVSGVAYSLPMPFPVLRQFQGVSFAYRGGRVDLWQTALRLPRCRSEMNRVRNPARFSGKCPGFVCVDGNCSPAITRP